MAKRHNMRAEKAKRNAEYALRFKKKKRPQPRRSAPALFSSSSPPTPSTGTESHRLPGHDAICSACGVATTLPFKPMTGKPVFCRACFLQAPV